MSPPPLAQHPDKNKHPSATAKFQALSLSHSILSDSKKRAQFDASGSVEDAESAQDLAAWSEYWRSLFPKVTVTKIDAFADEYRGSEEERQDVLRGEQRSKCPPAAPALHPALWTPPSPRAHSSVCAA